MEGSAQTDLELARKARHVLELYLDRAVRMVRSAPPGAVAPMIRTVHDVLRLAEGKSTSNVAVQLSGPERRQRIAELIARNPELAVLAVEEVDPAG